MPIQNFWEPNLMVSWNDPINWTEYVSNKLKSASFVIITPKSSIDNSLLLNVYYYSVHLVFSYNTLRGRAPAYKIQKE